MYTDLINSLIFSGYQFVFSGHQFLKISVNRYAGFSVCQSYIKLVTGRNSFPVDTDIQKQCTLINVKVFNNWLVNYQCTPVDF